ncbi:NTP transferase domain-containing protein [candidate division WWE3 bacterium]|nr:NTP transferase domain-containing protein [candidate division WWE3 bacterium]
MQKALQKLKTQVCDLKNPQKLPGKKFKSFIENTQVALMAGGQGTRFREVLESKEVNKNAHKLPNGETMIERTIKMYAKAGIKNFIALVYHSSNSIIEKLGNGEKLGVEITYSHDPDRPVGKGGAVLNALQNGSIDPTKNLIVHNPDDVIVNFEQDFVKHIISGHIQNVQQGAEASIVVVEETPYPFTGMKIKENKVEEVEMYPLIPIPTHIGVTIFSPEVFKYFPKLFDLTKKSDFEKVLFPILSKEKKLYAVSIPGDSWIAVNNLKTYKKFVEYLQKS